MKNFLTICALVLLCSSLSAQTEAQKYVRQLVSTEELKESVWGIKAVRLGGGTVAEHSSNTRMLPASNTKLVTTGLALLELGEGYRFKTGIACSGQISGGVLKGDIYIVGGGDPTIAARDSASLPLQTTFASWEKIIRDAGITRIEGRVIGDGRLFGGELEHYSWQYEDIGTDYAPGSSALMFYKNVQDFRVTPGARSGDPVSIVPAYPETPWLNIRSAARTAAAGTGNALSYVPTDMAPVAELRGTLGIDRAPFRMSGSNKFGAMTCAWYFYKYLEGRGIAVTDGPADIDNLGLVRDFSDGNLFAAAPSSSLTVLGRSESQPLIDIVKVTNSISDNLYAETLLRAIALESTGSAVYDSCSVARSASLKHLAEIAGGTVPATLGEDVVFVDGSGLSRGDYVTPAFFVDFLSAMVSTDVFPAFLSSLPMPGSGTLETRMMRAPQEVRSRVHMKSGSMGGVRCFSGYIDPTSGRQEDTIVFSVMTNNTIVASSRINFIMDRIITLLAYEN